MHSPDFVYFEGIKKQLLLTRQSYCESLLKQGYRCADELLLTLYKPDGTFSRNFEWLRQFDAYKEKVKEIQLSANSKKLLKKMYELRFSYDEFCQYVEYYNSLGSIK
jgi:hypothetical protein